MNRSTPSLWRSPGLIFPVLFLYAALLASLLAPSPRTAWGEDEIGAGDEEADSLLADSLRADSIAYVDSLAEIGLTPEDVTSTPDTGFHPRYKLSFLSDRDSQDQKHNLQNVNFKIGDRVEVSTSANTSRKKSRNVDQQTQVRTSRSSISYQLTDSVSLRSNLLYNFRQIKGRGDTQNRSTDNFDMGTAFGLRLPDDARMKFDLFGGSAGDRNRLFVSRGISGQLKSDLAYDPEDWMNVTLNYLGSRSYLNSTRRVDNLETQDKETGSTFNGAVGFQLPKKGTLRVDGKWDHGTFQRPDTTEIDSSGSSGAVLQQETKTLSERTFSFTSSLNPVSTLQITLDGNWNRRLIDFVIQTNGYQLNQERGGKIGLRYTLPTKTEVGVNFSNRFTERDFRPDPGFPDRSGETSHRSLVSSLSQRIGSVAEVDLSGKVDLQKETYDNKISFDQDKDVLDKRLTVGASYNALSFLRPSVNFTFRENEAIFILASRSSQNNVAQTYSLKPKLTFTISPKVSIIQTYSLDATYTEFTFDEDKNSISRIASLSTTFNYSLSTKVALSTSYNFRDSDNGTLIREGNRRFFDRQSQSQRQEMTVKLDYGPAPILNVAVTSRLQLENRWRIVQDVKTLQTSSNNEYLTAEFQGRYGKGDHLSLNYRVAFNLGDGPRVGADQEEYWTGSVDLSYTY